MENENKNLLNDGDIKKTDQGLIFNPFNYLNKEIQLNNIQHILSLYGINTSINNINLYKRAFIHRSYTKRPQIENAELNIKIEEQPLNCLPLSTKSNERLEFLGDGILECITKYYLYKRFPKEDEGFMTEKKIALVKNEHIGKLAQEMKLNNWVIISKHAEEKNTRYNLKKLGCLFEAFLGALFLDFNKINIHDDDKWFDNVFVTGPGFQIAQIFVESVFEKHVDWIALITNDDNYKNILQVRIQKEFKTTPHYIEISHDIEDGYKMGVYLCLGQQIHETTPTQSVHINTMNTYSDIHSYVEINNKILLYMGEGVHKIKKKAEQIACQKAIEILDSY